MKDIDLSNFDTHNVGGMSYMFNGCYSLKNIDVSGFNTSNVTDMLRMFAWCENLENIYVGPNWNLSAYCNTQDMFVGSKIDHVTKR